MHRIAEVVSAVGEGRNVALLGVVLLLAGLALQRRHPRVLSAARVLGVSGIACWALVIAGQFVLAEQRPIEGGQMRWFAAGGHGISGHAAAAALLLGPVVVLARRAMRPWSPLGRAAVVLVVVWALIVGWSRVELGMHYAWNVLLGLWLGWGAVAVALRSRLTLDVSRVPRNDAHRLARART